MRQKNEPLFAALAKAAEQRMKDFNTQDVSNTAWAFAKAGQKKEPLFVALATCVRRRIDNFNQQGLSKIAWAFSSACHEDRSLHAALATALTAAGKKLQTFLSFLDVLGLFGRLCGLFLTFSDFLSRLQESTWSGNYQHRWLHECIHTLGT